MERGLSSLDILKKEVPMSDKEDDTETLVDDPDELENSHLVKKVEKKRIFEAEEQENEKNALIYQAKPEPSPRKVSTELARHKLQKNLERILSEKNGCSREVISELTGAMTPTQVRRLIEKTNCELGKKCSKAYEKTSQECEVHKASNLPYWTPQPHRKSVTRHHSLRRNLTNKSEVFSARPSNQFFSPQVSKRKSVFQYFEDSSDSEVEAQKLPVKPIYLPKNAKVKAPKHRKTPLYANHPVVHTGCQGCCHKHKKTNEDKSCIIS